jgi:signal transduction histidine kinase
VLPSSQMRSPGRSSTLLPIVMLALLLGGLGVLQYRWLSELAAADLTRTRATARERARQLSAAFDREITRVFARVGLPAAAPESRAGFAAAWQEWRSSAPWPDLVAGVYLIEPRTDTLQRFDPAGGTFVSTPWPAALSVLRERLPRATLEARGERRVFSMHGIEGAVSSIPAILVPTFRAAEPPRGPDAGPAGGPPPPGVRGTLALVVLDPNVLASQVFPALAARFFDPRDGFDYVLRVSDGHEPERRFYETTGAVPGWRAEVTTGIFDVRLDAENRDLLDPRHGGPELRRGPPTGRSGRGRREPPGRWSLEVANRLQPFEEMVAANRRRNLFVSFGVLGLLGASALVLVASARRAQVLAQQQMEFVAGVSHELQTPLAVMTSAAENLADGVVREPEQVRRYGATLRAEARRLSALVDQVLGYVGTYSGALALEPEAVDVKSLVDDTLGALATPLRDAGMSVEVAVPEEIPPLQGNGAALRRCLANLVHNAIKYRGSSNALLITASEEAARGGRRVALTVSDRGVGFAPDEAARLFEPFFRGQAAVAAQAPGTGLGLAVVRRTVEALGGTVEAAPRGGGGSVFTLRLPASSQGTA